MPKHKDADHKPLAKPKDKATIHHLHPRSGHQKGNNGSSVARQLSMLGDSPRLRLLSRYLRGLDQAPKRQWPIIPGGEDGEAA